MTPLDNKYTKWYWELIYSRMNQKKNKNTECHHIIPKSLGGSNDPQNLINLTRREHFIAHLLLSKMFEGQEKSKMKFASRQMLGSYMPSSKTYEMVKRDANQEIKKLWENEEWKNQVIKERKLRCSDPDVKKEMSDIMIEVWKRPEYIKKHKAAMQEVYTNTQWLENNSIKQKEAWKDPDKRDRRLKNRKPHSEEIRKMKSRGVSEANKKSWTDPVVREKRIAGIKLAKERKKAAKEAAFYGSDTVFN